MDKFKSKILSLLREGSSPRSISLAIVLGLILGTIPILGSTTLLCTVAALGLRLNIPLILLASYFVYPVQLLIYVPLLLLGARLFDPSLTTLALADIYQMIKTNFWGTIERLFRANLGALLIWSVIAIPLGIVLFAVLQRIMRNFHKGPEPAL